jgi:glycerophosphoryl diester phosphodiesterase
VSGASIGRGFVRSSLLCALIVSSFQPVSARDESLLCAFCRDTPQLRLILNVAHAGASSVAPQNTMAAGQAAFDLGADVWGVDVRGTRDGALVLMHDETLERTTDAEEVFPARSPWRVADFRLDEIRTLDAGSWFLDEDPFGRIAEGEVADDALASYAGEPVPTLREALDFVAERDWLIDIEIKTPNDGEHGGVAERLVTLIEETNTVNLVLVSSFDHDFLREVREMNPAIPIGALSIFLPLNPLAYLRLLDVDVYLPSVVGFTDELLTELDKEGIKVIVWTYNATEQLEHAVGLPGVDGIYTDFPQRLAALLGSHVEEAVP